MLTPEVETRPWDEQRAVDDRSYREQLAYLFERSAFYREKLGDAGISSAADAGVAPGTCPRHRARSHRALRRPVSLAAAARTRR